MEFRIIKSPSAGTVDILARRMNPETRKNIILAGAIGLVQGRMIDMIYAADIAEKAVGVTVEDIKGSCPQNMIMIAIFGDTASVEAAIQEIRRRAEEGNKV